MAVAAGGEGPSFSGELRKLRAERSWSLRDLGERILYNRGYVGKVEQGEKFPDRRFAELADRAFGTGGTLVEIWDAEAAERCGIERVGKLLTESVRDSVRLLPAEDERYDLDQVGERAEALAIAYLATPPGPMLRDAVELRAELLRRLRDHVRPYELKDLYVVLGRLQGVLAYSALDLGNAEAAMTHAEAGWRCAEHAENDELRVWMRGTQSLISRFQGDYAKALRYVHDGLRYKANGTGRIRLLCGVAQCRANLGDAERANRVLDLASRERARLRTEDSVDGLFAFSVAKQHYYAASSLIWLPCDSHADRAAREAGEAIALWENEPPERRSLDDEALAYVYRGTALLQAGDLDAAADTVRLVLKLPAGRQISWIKKRLARFGAMLRVGPYRGSSAANELYEEIRRLVG